MVFCSAAMVVQKLLNQIKNWTNIRIGIQNITKNNFSKVDPWTMLSEPLKKTHENMKNVMGVQKKRSNLMESGVITANMFTLKIVLLPIILNCTLPIIGKIFEWVKTIPKSFHLSFYQNLSIYYITLVNLSCMQWKISHENHRCHTRVKLH